MSVTIEDPRNFITHSYEKEVLEKMFSEYERIVIRSRLTGGFSGSSVYMVRSIKQNTPDLPSVVKIDYHERIEQEWNAYQNYIKYRLPNVAEIRGEPINPTGSSYSGLWYPLAGAGVDDVESLNNYLLKVSLNDINSFLEKRLLRRFAALWQQTKIHPEFNFQAAYDDFLPLNLIIECTETNGLIGWLAPSSIHEQEWFIGQYVQVSGFKVVKLLRENHGLSLDTGESHRAFRIHVYGIENVSNYKIGQVIQKPFTGLIKETRKRLLKNLAQKALGSKVNLEESFLTSPSGLKLPNPITNWQQAMEHSMDVKFASIHGDLNMENVLVQQTTEDIYLLDFAKSHRGHVLRDLLHLEMTVVNKILPETLRENDKVASTINDLYRRLHCSVVQGKEVTLLPNQERVFTILYTIRQAARSLLFQMDNWEEYYIGLFLYLLGSLRFDDLDKSPTAPRPKQLAIWGAATILDILKNELDCEPLIKQNKYSSYQKLESESQPQKIQGGQIYEAKPSNLHLDAAVPRQVFVGRTSKVTVAVRWPNTPKLRKYMIEEGVSINESNFWHEYGQSEEIEIHFVASNCEINGPNKFTFPLGQDQPLHIFQFNFTPQVVSLQDLFFGFYRNREWVGSAFVQTSAEGEIVGGVQLDFFTFLIEKPIQSTQQRLKLLKYLDSNLNKEELINLCFELKIDYENLSGENKKAKARELITYCERRGRMKDLIQVSHIHIPVISLWSTLSRIN